MLANVLVLCAGLAAAAPPQWPPAPDPARLRYEYEIRLPSAPKAAPTKGFLYWLKALLGVESAAKEAAEAEALVRPTGVYARDGILYIADPGRAAVLRYDLAKREGLWLGKSTGLDLASPVAAVPSSDGRLFVLDSGLKKVLILDKKGKVVGELRGDPQGLGQPAGLALSEDRVFVSDVQLHRVSVYGLEGLFIQSFGRRGKGPGELNFPTYLWFDKPARQLWVTDSGNFRLQWFDPSGKPLGRLGQSGDRPGYLPRPRGLARDSEGHVYSSDGAFDALQLFDTDGRLLLFAGVFGAEPGQFDLPGGVTIDEMDRVFVADTQNGRVQVFQYLKEGLK